MTKIQLSTVILCVILVPKCAKIVAVDPPTDQITTAIVFESDSLAQAAVTGLYVKAMSNAKYLFNGGVTLFGGLSSDELLVTRLIQHESPFADNEIGTNNPLNYESLWTAAYTTIIHANVCAEGLDRSASLSPALKRRLLGEVSFMRALSFFHLVNLYGKIPLTLTSNPEQNRVLARTDVANVYGQIAADLVRADSLLPESRETVYPTRMACKALLAHLNLYRNDWEGAAHEASAVIDSRAYALEPDLDRVFLPASTETVFQLAPVMSNLNTVEGNLFIPQSQSGRPTYHLRQTLVDAFEPNDQRKSRWVGTLMVNGTAYAYPYKYKSRSANGWITEYNVVLRLAQQYLIRAEARLRLGDTGGCLQDLNTIRRRAGLADLSSSLSEQELMAAIEQENRIEFFSEWGHRWFDLKRWGRAAQVLAPLKSGFRPAAELFPIPEQDRLLNTNLDQNPGYH